MTKHPDLALRAALDRIARALLGASKPIDATLGQVTLRPHQLVAVTRLLEILASNRGALLADAVGLGKTYVALALARQFETPLVVCPAVLRPMWLRAMAATGVEAPVMTTEALSRGAEAPFVPALVIVDEAHHFRTPGTRRYRAIADLSRGARMLLMSATPLQNSRRDLVSLLALFAGSAVKGWSDEAMARLIVRRDEHTADQRLPAVSGPHALSPEEDDCLEAILGIPPAIPAADEGVAHALATMSLLHLWASSRAALLASVKKRLARASALRDVVAGGHMPTAAELSAWEFTDDSLQLAFPLFAPDATRIDGSRLEPQLDHFIAAANGLLARCRMTADPDIGRAKLLRALRERHRGERIVAFSQYADTVQALARLMWSDTGVAVVTASAARIASGAIPREEVLAQFAGGVADVRLVERIGLLLTTDLLSEGIDLRGASVVVNLDLPWNPARLEQRIGRARRLGSSFEVIHVYSLLPPVPAERMLQLRRRLTEKLRTARAVVGTSFDPFGTPEPIDSPVAGAEELRAYARTWMTDSPLPDDDCPVAAAAAPVYGWIAVVKLAGAARVIGELGHGIVEDPRRLLAVARGVRHSMMVDPERLETAIDRVMGWLDVREASAGSGEQPHARRAMLERLAQIVARAPRHRRASVLAAAQRTRAALAATTGIGAERVMASLARSTADDDAWLRSAETFGSLHRADVSDPAVGARLLALVLLTPGGDATPG